MQGSREALWLTAGWLGASVWLLASRWLSSDLCGHLGSDPVDGRLQVYPLENTARNSGFILEYLCAYMCVCLTKHLGNGTKA